MEIIKFALFVVAVYAPAVYCCDPQKMATECMSKIGELSTLAGNAQNDQAALKSLCDVMTSVQACIKKYTDDCAPEVKKQLASSLANMDSFNQMCDPNNPCSLQKIQDCFKGLPIDQASAENINYQDVCKKFPTAMKCVNNVQGACKDPNMIKSMESATAFFPMVDTECKKMYGDDYAVKMGGNGGGGDGNGADKLALLSLPLMILSLLAVKLGL